MQKNLLPFGKIYEDTDGSPAVGIGVLSRYSNTKRAQCNNILGRCLEKIESILYTRFLWETLQGQLKEWLNPIET